MTRRILHLVLAMGLLLAPETPVGWADQSRKPYVAGVFYPEREHDLSQLVDAYLREVPEPPEMPGRLVGALVPHAGYAFSGKTAAAAYRRMKDSEIETYILLGPYHKTLFTGASVWTGAFWTTPLGEIAVDTRLAKRIASESPLLRFDESAHLDEHSLEVQLPFIQRVSPEAKIVPILINDPSPENTALVAKVLWKYMRDRKAALIVSTDMSHYHPEAVARTKDAQTLKLLEASDREGLLAYLAGPGGELCGAAAALVLLEVGRLAGVPKLELLEYTTSASSAGADAMRVVGYSSFVMIQREEDLDKVAKPTEPDLLLKLARETVEAYISDTDLPELPETGDYFMQRKAVFVTLRKNDEIRGCIGRLYPDATLAEAVQNMAIEAATKDSRFSPVRPSELEDLSYEISILDTPRRVKSVDEIEMGTHGVVLRQGPRGGAFLPSVAEEFDNDKEAFLSELCVQKAGLPAGCWKDPKSDLFVFTTQDLRETA